MKDFLLKFLQEQWAIVLLCWLIVLLSGTHAFMIHYNRPPTVIQWCEGMITGAFSALLAKLK